MQTKLWENDNKKYRSENNKKHETYNSKLIPIQQSIFVYIRHIPYLK